MAGHGRDQQQDVFNQQYRCDKLPSEGTFCHLLFPSALAFSFWWAEGARPQGYPASGDFYLKLWGEKRTPHLWAFTRGRLYTEACPWKHRSWQSFGWSWASSWTLAGSVAMFCTPSALGPFFTLFTGGWGLPACLPEQHRPPDMHCGLFLHRCSITVASEHAHICKGVQTLCCFWIRKIKWQSKSHGSQAAKLTGVQESEKYDPVLELEFIANLFHTYNTTAVTHTLNKPFLNRA